MLEENLIRWRKKTEAQAQKKGMAEGKRVGRQEGLQEGLQKGRQAGAVEGMQRLVLRQLERRFGPLPPAVRRRVKAVASIEELESLADRVLVATCREELGLG